MATVVGDVELLVDLKLNPRSVASLKSQVSRALRGTTGGTGIEKVQIDATRKAEDAKLKIVDDAEKRRQEFRQRSEQAFARQSARLVRIETEGAKKAAAAVTSTGRAAAGSSGLFGKLAGSVGLTNTQLAQLFGAGLSASATLLAFRFAIQGVQAALREVQRDLQAASARTEAFSATAVVFGQAARGVTDFVQASAGLGLSQRAAADAARTFGLLLTNIGVTGNTAARTSVFLTQLSADLASFANIQGGVEEASRLLMAGLVGETEALRRLGIIIDDISTKEAAQRLGIARGNEELSQRTKVLVRLIQVSEQTSAIQGDFTNTAQGLANTMRVLNAVQEDVRADIGGLLAPAAVKAAQAFTGLLIAVRTAIAAFQQFKALRNILAVLFPGLILVTKLFNALAKVGKEAFDEEVRRAAATRENTSAIQGEIAAIAQQIQTIERLNNLVDTGGDLVIQAVNAEHARDAALLAVRRSLIGVEQAENALRDARQAQGDNLLALREAELGRIRALLDQRQSLFFVQDAVREQIRAQQDLTFAQEDFADTQRKLASDDSVIRATLNLQEAQLALQEATLGTNKALIEQLDAQLALRDAEFDLERAQRRGRAGARDQLRAITAIQRAQLQAADAALAPERARLQLARATLGLTDAELDYQKAISGVAAQRELVRASRELEDAQIRVRDSAFEVEGVAIRQAEAVFSVARAEIAVREAGDAIVDGHVALVSAQLGVAEAHLAVEGAVIAAANSVVELAKIIAELEGEPLTGKQKVDLFTGALKELGGQLPGITALVDKAREAIDKIPTKKTSTIELETELARLEAKAFADEVEERVKRMAANVKESLTIFIKDILAKLFDAAIQAFTLAGLGGVLGAQLLKRVAKSLDLPGFASGGDIRANQLSVVGEKGPELFAPKTSGLIIPHIDARALFAFANAVTRLQATQGTVSRTVGAAQQILNFNDGAFRMPEGVDYRVFAAAVAREIARRSKR